MKKMTINCSICNEVMAEIEKEIITNEDIQMYQQMMSCPVDGPYALCSISEE